MNSLRFIFVALVMAMLITACGGSTMTPQEVYEAYHAAVEGGDLDGAMAYIAKDARFKVPVGTLHGTEEIRVFLEQNIKQDPKATCENFNVNGDILTCDFIIDFGSWKMAGDLVVTIVDGRITDYDFSPTG